MRPEERDLAYFGEILVERIWLTATKSLPDLRENLEKLLPEK